MAEIKKPNMDPKKAPMPAQDPNVRNKNFLEVCTGYSQETAMTEATRCLHCKNHPCGGLPRQRAYSRLYRQGRRGRLQGRL